MHRGCWTQMQGHCLTECRKSMKQLSLFCLFIALLFSCEDDGGGVNPFDEQIVNQDTVVLELVNPDPASIAGIYQNIFRPTCANVGCHDGTFEPDFRTLESSYNTLVFQEPIKNDGNYLYRVNPGNPQTSVIMARLENSIGPQMPIQIEPDSDWPAKKTEYINNIRTWITAGAPDISGNVRGDNKPTAVLIGAAAMSQGSWLTRSANNGPIKIASDATEMTLYFAFYHDDMESKNLTHNKIRFANTRDAFDVTDDLSLTILSSPVFERGFYGETVAYTHKIDFNPGADLGTTTGQWYFRVYVQDNQNPVTELPTNDAIFHVKEYMSFKWQ